MATLKALPIIFFVQDNEWDISAHSSEIRFGDATTFSRAFPGMKVKSLDGTDFLQCYQAIGEVLDSVRMVRKLSAHSLQGAPFGSPYQWCSKRMVSS